MAVCAGVDLHSTNSEMAIVDQAGKRLHRKRCPNELGRVVKALEPYRSPLGPVVVRSPFDWYWLVDGLCDAGPRLGSRTSE